MKSAFANKMSYFVLTFIFLIIIASFLFSGFDKFSLDGLGKNVATVDGTPITSKEYQMAIRRQIEFFNQMMGGKDAGLTSKQLEEMGIKQSVLNSLIQQKLMLNMAQDMKILISLDEIKNEIKEMPFFKTQNRFDVNLYRNMLQSNGYIPTQFEELVGNDLKQKKLEELFKSTLASESFVSDVLKFKNNGVVITGVKISRQSLNPKVFVNEKEIEEYVKNEANKSALEASYNENFSKYNKPEEIKARHILIQGSGEKELEKITEIRSKLSAKNFNEVANKETQDPTGKKNGGDLGWFSPGRMVPEFDKAAFGLKKGEISSPVKTSFGYHIIYVEDKKAASKKPLEEVKQELAKTILQKSKGTELDKLLKEETARFENLLKADQVNVVESESKALSGEFFNKTLINQYDQNLAQVPLSPSESEKIFKAKAGDVLDFSNPGNIYILKIVEFKKDETGIKEKLKAELTSQGQSFGRKAREELLREMNNKAKIVTNPALM